MDEAVRRRAAHRWAAGSVGIAALIALAPEVRAGGDPVLVLPLSRALALVERAARPRASVGPAVPSPWRRRSGAPPPPPGFIPKRIRIPDLYQVEYERDVPRFAEPVDNDRLVALNLLAPVGRRPGLAFRVDGESLPLGDGSKRLSVEVELPF